VRVFKTKWFVRFARKENISDDKLREVIREAESGLNEGELGSGLIKKRIARPGEGKRGGHRTIIVYRTGDRAIFVYGFTKNAIENIDDSELKAYQELARIFLSFDNKAIIKALSVGELKEVEYHGQKMQE
jgi:hypothetical protein